MSVTVRVCSLLAVVSLVCVCLTGCGESGPDVATVKGTVTLDGEPLEGAMVTFQPENGRPADGTTDSQGQYELLYTAGKPGAKIGKHTVTITTSTTVTDEEGNMTATPEKLPPEYNVESELVREVEPGENIIDFDLTSDPAGSAS